MSIEALWIAEYRTAHGDGHGVVVIDNGRIYGGDHGHFFTGTVRTDGNEVFAEIRVTNYWPAVPSLLNGPGPVPLDLKGRFDDVSMHLVEQVLPGQRSRVDVTMVKRAQLP